MRCPPSGASRSSSLAIGPARPAPAKTLAAAGRRVKARNLAAFTRQFAVMIDAGLPLVSVSICSAQRKPTAGSRAAIRQTRADVERGSSLADAMKKHPTCSTRSTRT